MRFEEYFEPQTIEECIELKNELGDRAVFVAGGTDVVPKLKTSAIRPDAVISLHRLKELNGISFREGGLFIGALTTLRKLSLSDELKGGYRVIAEAAGHVSSLQIRNTATIGGNACNASPSADAVQGLMVLDAVCLIKGMEGMSEIPIADFFTGPGKTALKNGELLTGFFVPEPQGFTEAAYVKYSIRGDTDISIVGAAAAISRGDDTAAKKVRISLAAVAPVPLRVFPAEDFLTGKVISENDIDEASDIAKDFCSPIDDQRATAGYRKEMVKVQTRIALEQVSKALPEV